MFLVLLQSQSTQSVAQVLVFRLTNPQPSTPPQPSSVSTLVSSQTLQLQSIQTSSYQLFLLVLSTLLLQAESQPLPLPLPPSHHLSHIQAHSVHSSVEP